jgi:hypothetical protein
MYKHGGTEMTKEFKVVCSYCGKELIVSGTLQQDHMGVMTLDNCIIAPCEDCRLKRTSLKERIKSRIIYNQHDLGELGKYIKIDYAMNIIDEFIKEDS